MGGTGLSWAKPRHPRRRSRPPLLGAWSSQISSALDKGPHGFHPSFASRGVLEIPARNPDYNQGLPTDFMPRSGPARPDDSSANSEGRRDSGLSLARFHREVAGGRGGRPRAALSRPFALHVTVRP